MFEYILCSKSDKAIKTNSTAGKRLLKDYAEKYENVVNPFTNKVVQSRGRVGQRVLHMYQRNLTGGNDASEYRNIERCKM